MEEGRKVELKTDLEIKAETKRKSTWITLLMLVAFAIFAKILHVIDQSTPLLVYVMIWTIISIMIIIFGKLILPKAYEEIEYYKRNKIRVELMLSAERVQIIPIEDEFISSIISNDTSKIYANLDENDDENVVISISFSSNPSFYYEYKRVDKGSFLNSYKLKEEKE